MDKPLTKLGKMKDLTWQDIKRITDIYEIIAEEALTNYLCGQDAPSSDEEFYTDVLNRFLEERNNKVTLSAD